MSKITWHILSITCLLILGLLNCQKKESHPTVKDKPTIYDEETNAEELIQNAIVKASDEKKNILLMFGGNWCPWCHRLHNLFENNKIVHDFLETNYVLVMVNVARDREKRNMAINETYGNPYQFGFPVLVVLDGSGKQLTTQETGSLEKTAGEGEEQGHDPEKVMAFLKQWSPENT